MFVRIKIFKIKNATLLESIEIGIQITKDYPYRQPFVWIIKPLLKYKTNYTNNTHNTNNLDSNNYEINHQIQWSAAFGIEDILIQTIELLDNDKWFIDENELQK